MIKHTTTIDLSQRPKKRDKKKLLTSPRRGRIPPTLKSPPTLKRTVFLVGQLDENGFHIQHIFTRKSSAEQYVREITSAWGDDAFSPCLRIREWEITE